MDIFTEQQAMIRDALADAEARGYIAGFNEAKGRAVDVARRASNETQRRRPGLMAPEQRKETADAIAAAIAALQAMKQGDSDGNQD